ncbi:O-antigen ligase family protein [bacterium]|nr:O-antigen ligase family protein [bacterium]
MVDLTTTYKKNLVIYSVVLILCLMIAFALSGQHMNLIIGAVVGIGLFIFGFLSPIIALYLLILSMLLSPEFGTRDISGKGFTIRFEDFLLVIMGFTWLAKSAVKKDIGLAVKTRLNLPILFYLLACIVATTFGIIAGNVKSPLTGFMFVMKYFEYFVIYFLVINNIQSKSEIRNLLVAIFVTYVIVVIVGLSQIPQGGRVTAPFEGEGGEPNTLGGYLVMMFSLNVILFFNVKTRQWRIGLFILAALNFLLLLHTLSRASWLAFITTYTLLIFFSEKRKVFIFFFIISFLLAPFVLPKTVVDRFLYTFDMSAQTELLNKAAPYLKSRNKSDLLKKAERYLKTHKVHVDGSTLTAHGLTVDSSTAARLLSMKGAIEDFPKRPVFGYGVTGYAFMDAQFPRILIETGIFGLVTFLYLLWVVGTSLLRIWKEYRDDPLYKTLSAGTLCAFGGLLVHSIGTNTFIIVRIMEPFWCLMGLTLAIPMIEKDHKTKKI